MCRTHNSVLRLSSSAVAISQGPFSRRGWELVLLASVQLPELGFDALEPSEDSLEQDGFVGHGLLLCGEFIDWTLDWPQIDNQTDNQTNAIASYVWHRLGAVRLGDAGEAEEKGRGGAGQAKAAFGTEAGRGHIIDQRLQDAQVIGGEGHCGVPEARRSDRQDIHSLTKKGRAIREEMVREG